MSFPSRETATENGDTDGAICTHPPARGALSVAASRKRGRSDDVKPTVTSATAIASTARMLRCLFRGGRLRLCCCARSLRHAFRTILPVLRRRDVRHPPVVAVPSVEAIHVQRPEARRDVADHDEAIRIAHRDTPRAIEQ